MAALTNTSETNLLKLLFQNVDWANIGDATGLRGSSVAGSFYFALFTADPTESGSTSNECAYTGYARKAVARSTGEFSVTNDTVTNINDIEFDLCTAGSETATHGAIMTALSGGVMVAHGALAASLAISANIRPRIVAGAFTGTAA